MATGEKVMEANLRSVFARRPALAILATIAIATVVPSAATAETQVTGGAEAVRLEASDATVDEAFAALGAAFGLRYRSAVALDRRITGTYQGSIEHVISRLLVGYNFFIVTSSGSAQVIVVGNPSATAEGGPHAAVQSIGATSSPQAKAAHFRD
jgi:hypothetical protein